MKGPMIVKGGPYWASLDLTGYPLLGRADTREAARDLARAAVREKPGLHARVCGPDGLERVHWGIGPMGMGFLWSSERLAPGITPAAEQEIEPLPEPIAPPPSPVDTRLVWAEHELRRLLDHVTLAQVLALLSGLAREAQEDGQ